MKLAAYLSAPDTLVRGRHPWEGEIPLRSYELLFIVRPGLDEEAMAALMERLQSAVRDNGGKILRIDSMGRRKLAYPIAKQTEGHYMILQAEMDQTVIRQVERLIALSEDIIRHLLVRMDDEQE
jgi:small subunit ribosomal protein S6